MKLKEIKSLIKMANNLDDKGFYKEADILDEVILKLSQEKSGGLELHIYDFDGTLFRSPHQPSSWEKDWWSDPASLLPPCVPENPGAEWWIGETVESAKRSISDVNVFSIMMTGRKQASAFSYRIAELLSQAGLDFDRVHLSVGAGDALGEKIDKAFMYLLKYPRVDTVRIWDDRPSHLSEFESALKSKGYTVYTTHVNARSMNPLCEEKLERSSVGPKKVSYVGIFLDSSSKADLVNEFTLKHNKIGNDHITLSMKLTPELERMIGQRVESRVVGYSEDDKGQAVAVELPSDLPYLAGSIPHVTLSHSSDVDPKYSKDLLEKGFESISGPTISGYIDTYPRSLIQKISSDNSIAKVASDPAVGTGKKPKGSGRRLYTDENPKDTVSVKFRTKEDIVATLSKESFKSKSHKRQSQIINLIHQRVGAAYRNAKDVEVKRRLKRAYDYISKRKERSKEKTKRLKDL